LRGLRTFFAAFNVFSDRRRSSARKLIKDLGAEVKFRLQASFPIIAAAIRPRRQILDYRDKVWPRTVANVKKVAAFETNPWRSSMAVFHGGLG
jgi:hypothetical protein